jgi:diguanylate cyclase (GGDEF)-like protein
MPAATRLRTIAQIITEGIRGSDSVFRYGGDEFVVVCPGTPHGAAMLLAERLRTALKLRSAGAPGGKITISAGVATSGTSGSDLLSLFSLADERLYAAKNAGRDRVVGDSVPLKDKPFALDQAEPVFRR